jgi:23S rRNA (adenine2503-C2)-methyltransferase
MQKADIKNLSKEELGVRLEALGAEPYRARQIFKWLYKTGARSFDPSTGSGSNPELVEGFDEMTDIPADLKTKLKSNFRLTHFVTVDSRRSRLDGTTKYLFRLEDGNTIEAVFLPAHQSANHSLRSGSGRCGAQPEGSRATACLSSQVGCKMGCSFCASTPAGFVRNLTAAEIMEEVLQLELKNPSKPVTNLVFMGIGEPLDNYENVLKSIRIFNDKDAFNIGARRITISTCGLVPAMKKLAAEGLQVELSVSLHSAANKVRSELVPVNKKYPLTDLITACREYVEKTNRIITFEYIMIKGVNSSRQDAVELAKLLKGLKCKVNTIVFNQVNPVRNCISNGIKAIDYYPPSEEEAGLFMKALKAGGVNAIGRKPRGADIDAGCGQLRISRL